MSDYCPISQADEQIAKKLKTSHTNLEDPTLKLPNHVLRSIFSYLKSDDLFNIRLVSKIWHRNTPSYFSLDFDEFVTPDVGLHESHTKFLDSIRSSLETSEGKLKMADKRVVRVQFKYDENLYDVLRLIEGNDFYEVYLSFGFFDYSIPFIFQSKCLTVLHLHQCGIEESLFIGDARFDSVSEIQLDRVTLTGQTLSKFISKCAGVRELRLVNCELLRSIVLCKVDRLKKFYVQLLGSYPCITDVLVVAPSLEVFHFVHYNSSKVAVKMDIRACRMLREFHLRCSILPVGLGHEDFCSDFPHLENLLLGLCVTGKRVKISSPSLRNLTLKFTQLYNYKYSRKSVLSVPNLCSYQYVGRSFKSSFGPSDAPKFLKISISLAPRTKKINRAWFLQLRRQLTKISSRVVLAFIIHDQASFSELGKRGHKLWSMPIGRTSTQVLPRIQHLKLDIRLTDPEESLGCLLKYIINNLLWMSRPNALTLSMPASFTAFALGVCNELFISTREGSCCANTQNKCWRHFLEDFMIKEVVIDEKEEAKMFRFVFTWQLFS
ncbi:hypothetical protein T459_10841 [Capsicum annuum]|uniref:F-box domain-containing protein n=1 Tax=Capsicum annuum TaxID=4072 RepID=A0A2G3A3C2_CAPAN|nr:hypothetical protein T459_10841 [Capsicum annuum]